MTIFGIDAASYQGNVDWAVVDQSTDFGAEKVSEGIKYANPFWPAAKAALLARAKATGFVPLAYFFMDAGATGTAQADWFAANAGNLDGFGISIDLERAPDGSPTEAQAREAVGRIRQLYPHHRIGGYAPHWYTGAASLTFFDWTWASEYISGTGSPESLYASVPPEWWAAYGGMTPLLLQFTSTATVSGVSGVVDCSAYKGTQAELATHVLPQKPVTPPVNDPSRSDGMLMILSPGAPAISCPVWANAPAGTPAAFRYAMLSLAGETGAVVKLVMHDKKGQTSSKVIALTNGHVVSEDLQDIDMIMLTRADRHPALGASARLVNW